MISVLIPIFNYNVTGLVTSINSQLLLLNIDFEIICIDDASTNYFLENDKILEINNINLIKLSNNIGRSKIRNLLVKNATYEWLLFLDSDVFPRNDIFCAKYIKSARSNSVKVYCGGIAYSKEKPKDDKMLRWVYGKNREEISLEIRRKNQYQYFFGANFLINKSVFNTCKFNEGIVKYGYEDTLFVEDLRQNSIELQNIDNAVYHNGIEDNSVFLAKTKQAIENLYDLSSQGFFKNNRIKILNFYRKISAVKLTWIFCVGYFMFHKLFEYNLKSKWPSMLIFDLYKLLYLSYLDVSKNSSQ